MYKDVQNLLNQFNISIKVQRRYTPIKSNRYSEGKTCELSFIAMLYAKKYVCYS